MLQLQRRTTYYQTTSDIAANQCWIIPMQEDWGLQNFFYILQNTTRKFIILIWIKNFTSKTKSSGDVVKRKKSFSWQRGTSLCWMSKQNVRERASVRSESTGRHCAPTDKTTVATKTRVEIDTRHIKRLVAKAASLKVLRSLFFTVNIFRNLHWPNKPDTVRLCAHVNIVSRHQGTENA